MRHVVSAPEYLICLAVRAEPVVGRIQLRLGRLNRQLSRPLSRPDNRLLNMKNTNSDSVSFGFFSELEKLGFIPAALRAGSTAISLLSSAGRRDGSGGSAGLTANTAKSLSESGDPGMQFLGRASGAAAAFKKFRGGDEAPTPSASFASSAPPGAVAS